MRRHRGALSRHRAPHRPGRAGAALADSVVDRVPRQGVLCFVDVAPAWFTRTFELERITVTWRRLLVDPMLSVTTYGPQTRLELIRHLDARFPSA